MVEEMLVQEDDMDEVTSDEDPLEDVLERCKEHPTYQPREKESSIHFDAKSDRYTISSFNRGVYRNLLRRDDFDLEWMVGVHTDDPQAQERLETVGEAAARSDLQIVGVVGTLPISTLKIGVGRQHEFLSGIVGTY